MAHIHVIFFNSFVMSGSDEKVRMQLNPTLWLPCSYSYLFSAHKGATFYYPKQWNLLYLFPPATCLKFRELSDMPVTCQFHWPSKQSLFLYCF